MDLFRTRRPNVKALARRGNVDALVAASGLQDLVRASGGEMIDRGAEVRRDAILALGEIGPEAGAEAVAAALYDPSDDVRLAAVRVLFARRQATTLAAMAWLPPSEKGHARRHAMTALARLRQPDCVPALAAALVHADGEQPLDEEGAGLLVVLLEGEEASNAAGELVEVLLTALADERGAVSARAEELLVRIAPASTEDVVAELKAGAVPYRAAAVLARIKDTQALEPLMEALLHRDARVRAESAIALGALGDPAAVEALIHASRAPEKEVATEADRALDRLGTIALIVRISMMVLEAVAARDRRPVHQGSRRPPAIPAVTAEPATPLPATGPPCLAPRRNAGES